MEAVPRMPMVCFDLKTSPDQSSFGALKQYIAEYYNENPESYSKECYQLNQLRGNAVRPTENVEGTATIRRYYCQLHSIQNRFLLGGLGENQQMLSFTWKNIYYGSTVTKSNIKYEMAAVLYNFGALHTRLGAAENRSDPESMKKACTHFQCAAWAFGYVKENYALLVQGDLSTELLSFMQTLCFAQAQECIMEKSLCDNRKSGIIAKVTAQIVSYYNAALTALLAQSSDDSRIQNIVGTKQFKEWRRYVRFKVAYLSCILLLYQGQQAEELQKMGERVAFYQSSFEKLEEARKESKGLASIDQINDALQFTMDVVEAKRKLAKNENEFIYHEEVPEVPGVAVQGANLVHGIAFSVTDPEAMGEDIFHRLVPMKAHESSSVYSEEKATLLRGIGAKIEDKDTELSSFISSLNLDAVNLQNPASFNEVRLPQGLVDRCAELNAKPNAISELVQSMSHLADTCSDVELTLKEIKNLLQQNEVQEDRYQQKIGQRSNGGAHIAELNRELMKYQEAHNKAGESNETLRKAMGLHVHNLRILAQPLRGIKEQVPTTSEQFDEATLKELQMVLSKVTEMRDQRTRLYQELRNNVTDDDITSQLIALEAGPEHKHKMDELFKKELGKHDQLLALVEQNLKAQGNILKALTEVYAKCAPIIKSYSEAKTKREQFFSSLQASYDVYEDLLSKSAKGLEFYKKLQGNVQKLYSRVKAACDVQDEERTQKLKSSNALKKQDPGRDSPKSSTTSSGPKLKDYLKSGNITLGSIKAAGVDSAAGYVPPVRPNPVGSESNAPPVGGGQVGYYQDSYAAYNYHNQNYGHIPSTSGFDYSQYNQQQAAGSYSTATATATASTTASSSTGYVNPMYQNVTSGYYYNQQQQPSPADYGQHPSAQASPAPSTTSSDASQGAQWSQLNQQFSTMNLHQPVDVNYYHQNQSYQTPQQSHHTAGTSATSQYGGGRVEPTGQVSTMATSQPYQDYSATSTYPPTGNQPQYGDPNVGQTSAYATPATSAATQPQYAAQVNQQYQQYLNTTNDAAAASMSGYANSAAVASPSMPDVNQPNHQSTTYANYYPQQATVSQYYPQQTPQPTYPEPSVAAVNSQTQPGCVYNPQTGTYEYATGYQYDANSTSYQSQYASNPQVPPVASIPDPVTVAPGHVLPDGQQQVANNAAYGGYYETSTYPTVQSNQYPPAEVSAPPTSITGVNDPNSTAYSQHNGSHVSPSVNAVPPVTTTTISDPPAPVPEKPIVQKTSSNIDLLSGIDFTPAMPMATPILQPQPSVSSIVADDEIHSEILSPTKVQPPPLSLPPTEPSTPAPTSTLSSSTAFTLPAPSVAIDRKPSVDNLSICSDLSSSFDWESASMAATGESGATTTGGGSILNPEHSFLRPGKDAFENPATVKWFHKEVERLEKFIESLNVKTLNGTTPLDSKWKELQDMLVKEESKRQVSVARLFPEKNRSIDSVPYDHARVQLPTATDNYINAVYVKDLGFGCPHLILAQTPLQNTVNDFWNMIWSQKSNVVVCLHTPNELLDPFWPLEINQELSYGDVSVTLLKQFDLSHCVERTLRVTMLGADYVLTVALLQNKSWPKNCAEHVLGIAQNLITAYRQQNQEQKQLRPLVLNCLNGTDRSTLVAVAITTILASQARKPVLINVVDIWYRMCCQRKGTLRDPNFIQLSYQIVLSNGHSILNKRGIMTSYQMKSAQVTATVEKEEATNDPFKDLDPLWKLK